jgi:hypothetical protein
MNSFGTWLHEEGFNLVAARDLVSAPEQVRNRMGVYLILIKDVVALFNRAELSYSDSVSQWSVDGYQQVYVGEGVSVRSRAMFHLQGDLGNSAVREFLLALQFIKGAVWGASNTERREEAEARLDEWLLHNTAIAFQHCAFAGDVERDLIRRLPSPFNVRHNERTPLLSSLIDARDGYRRHLKVTDQRPPRLLKQPSAWLRADGISRTSNPVLS